MTLQIQKKFIIRIATAFILLLIIGLVFFFPQIPEKPVEKPVEEDDKHIHWKKPTAEDMAIIKSLRAGPLKDIEKQIPKGAPYSISYVEDKYSGEPRFRVMFQATTWQEFFSIQRKVFDKFRRLGADPCEPLLRNAITFENINWAAFDWDSPDPEDLKPLCP